MFQKDAVCIRMKGIKARLKSYYKVINANNESLDKAQTDRNQTITWTIYVHTYLLMIDQPTYLFSL